MRENRDPKVRNGNSADISSVEALTLDNYALAEAYIMLEQRLLPSGRFRSSATEQIGNDSIRVRLGQSRK